MISQSSYVENFDLSLLFASLNFAYHGKVLVKTPVVGVLTNTFPQ